MTNPKRRIELSVALALLLTAGAAAQQSATATRTAERVGTLASEKFAGRLVGSDGERMAAEYLAAELKRIGAVDRLYLVRRSTRYGQAIGSLRSAAVACQPCRAA